MAKSTPNNNNRSGLGHIASILEDNNRLIASQSSAINKFIANANKDKMVEGKEGLEKAREAGKPGMGMARRVGNMSTKGMSSALGVISSGFKGLLAPITAGLGVLLAPLTGLGKLLMRGGAIGLVITGMYELFKDIGENPTFTKTIESIKTTWNDRILPTFNKIKESISALSDEDNEVGGAIRAIGEWFTNFKVQLQDWILGSLSIVTDTVANVLSGIDTLLTEGWMSGIKEIVLSLLGGIGNLLDLTITNILELFGADFGEDGSLMKSIITGIDRTVIKMTGMWTAFTDGVKDVWDGLVNFFVGEDGYIQTRITSLKTSVTLKWMAFTDTVRNVWGAMVDFFTNPETEGSIPYRINAIKTYIGEKWLAFCDSIKNTWGSMVTFLTNPEQEGSIPNRIMAIKDHAVEKWQMVTDTVKGAWNGVVDAISLAVDNVRYWLATKPAELGFYLEEKWIETQGKFKEKLASLAGAIVSLPAQLKLGLLESLKGTWLGDKFISDERIAEAQAEVASREGFSAAMISAVRSSTAAQLDELNNRRNAFMENVGPAPGTTIVDTSSQTTQNSVNLNTAAPIVQDPYSSSYMGQMIPGRP